MHYLKKLPTIAALSTLIVTSITAPAPAPQTTHIMTLSASGKATEADTAAAQFIGVITMFQDGGCDGGKTEEVELYGGPGTYGCYAVPWAMDSVEFTQGIGAVPGCSARVWSGSNCEGSSKPVPVQECLTAEYAAVSVGCVS